MIYMNLMFGSVLKMEKVETSKGIKLSQTEAERL